MLNVSPRCSKALPSLLDLRRQPGRIDLERLGDCDQGFGRAGSPAALQVAQIALRKSGTLGEILFPEALPQSERLQKAGRGAAQKAPWTEKALFTEEAL